MQTTETGEEETLDDIIEKYSSDDFTEKLD